MFYGERYRVEDERDKVQGEQKDIRFARKAS